MNIDFRDKYGITPREFADKYFNNYRINDGEIIPDLCPFCKGGRNNDKRTFALNIHDGAYNDKRSKCGVRGSFYELLKEFGEIEDDFTVSDNKKPHVQQLTKNPDSGYEVPDTTDNTTNLSDEILDWFEWRGISEETLDEWNIMEKEGNIAFPYYDKEGEEIVLMKYRTPNRTKEDKSIWQAGGGKHVLWGLEKLNPQEPLCIVEGEVDAISLTEAGFNNVTSVPFGAEQYGWLDNNWDLIDQFDEIILWMDKDKPGQKTTETLIKRLGKWRCRVVSKSTHKDANKVLFVEGEEAVREAMQNAEELSINGLHQMSDIEDWDPTEQETILSSLDKVNQELRGYILPSVTIITGLSGSGKSTFVNQEIVHAVSQGYKALIYSGELKPPLIRYWMERQMCTPDQIAKKEDEKTNSTSYFVPKEYKGMIRSWYNDRLYIYDTEYETGGEQVDYKDRLVTAEKLLGVFEYAVKRYGVDLFVIDNLMTIDFSLGLDSKWDEQTRFLGMVKNFANQFDVAIHLVAHPRKSEGNIGIEDIAGRMNIVNFVDNILSVSRINNKKSDDLPDYLRNKDSAVTFLKDRLYGTKKHTEGLLFDKPTKRMYEKKKKLITKYDWTPSSGVEL